MGQTIQFPDTTIGIPDEKALFSLDHIPIPKMVIWVDSTECSSCRIGNLYRYEKLYDKSQKDCFEVIIIFSPREDEFDEAMRMVELRHFDFPVYFDYGNSFGKSNNIPSDRRLHTFLLDYDNRICLIGDPTSNEKLGSLFDETIRGIEKDRRISGDL